MPREDPPPPAEDPAELIAQAKREAAAKLAEEMLARMQEDDERDEREGIELGDSTNAPPNSGHSSGVGGGAGVGLESNDDWDLSGRSSSRRSSSALDSMSSEGTLSGVTLAEGSAQGPTTLNVPIEINQGDDVSGSGDDNATQGDPPVPLYRPGRRPAMAVLVACDDGRADGEEVRVRTSPFDVGRVEGDLVIAHDHQMSRRHFRIERKPAAGDGARHEGGGDGGEWEWRLADLDSLNGTFLRQQTAWVDDGDEFLLAGEVIRVQRVATSGAGDGGLTLVKVAAGSTEERVVLRPGVHLLGADVAACVPFLRGAPLLASQHLRLHSNRSGRWTVTALPGADGLWIRKREFRLESGAQWQTGEQRFVFLLT